MSSNLNKNMMKLKKSLEYIRLMRNKKVNGIKNRQIEDLEEMINSCQQKMF